MIQLLVHLWAGVMAVYCIVQVIKVFQTFRKSEGSIGPALWGLVSAYCAVEFGALALGIRGPLVRLILAN